jgi:hypothetical protein
MPRFFLTPEEFNCTEQLSFVQIPEAIKLFYINTGVEKADLVISGINHSIEKKRALDLDFEFTPEFAFQICEDYFIAFQENQHIIKVFDSSNFISHYPDELSYILIEGPSFYDVKTDQFNHPFLESVYSKRVQNEWLIKTWVLHGNCGGFCGIILNTSSIGHCYIGVYGQFLSLTYEGKEYSFYHYERYRQSALDQPFNDHLLAF